MPTAHVNGIDINYECLGEGVPLLFIHGGYGGASTTLAPRPHDVREILPRDRVRTIVYDRRNAFRSGYTDDHYDLETLAAEAAGLLDHLGVERAIICGSSAGGPIALQFALSRPERVLALCLPNTAANLANPERPAGRSRREWVDHARSDGDRAAFEARKAALRRPPPVPSNPRPDDAYRIKKLESILASLPDDDLYHYAVGELRNYEAYLDWDCSERLGELQMPVCIIHGTSDHTVPFDWGHALHKGIPHSEFHAIEGADHGVLSYPAAGEVLRHWVGRVTG